MTRRPGTTALTGGFFLTGGFEVKPLRIHAIDGVPIMTRPIDETPAMHPDAYELRMPKYMCPSCGQLHPFPFAARFCAHDKPEPGNIIPPA